MNSPTATAPRLAVHTESTGADTLGEEERHAVDAVRFLAADAVERAQSGHPGTAMALAPLGVQPHRSHQRRLGHLGGGGWS